MEFAHIPILPQACLELLDPTRGGIFVDCTLGGGGHAELVLRALGENGRLIGIDRDAEALAAASERLKPFGDRFVPVRGNFFDIKRILAEQNVPAVNGILADLGVSSYQLDNPERGFSYHNDAPLDMRMDQSAAFTASDVVNGYSERELTRVLRDWGEERWAARIASFIVKAREKKPIQTTFELVDLIKAAIPASARREGGHPAKRTFQAIRIEVNGELAGLTGAVEDMVDCLQTGGRVAILTFHSLEDRAVKQTFHRLQNPCICPPDAPVCICGKKPTVRVLNRKPITADQEEIERNSRAKSAKLRAAEKI